MEHKTCKAVVLNTDEAQGIVECIFSVFGILDFGNDIVHSGAFTKTWNERSHKIKLLDSHNTNSVLAALGKPLEFRELRRGELPQAIMDEYPEATGGAWAKVQFNMKTDAGRDAFWHVHDGDTDEWSYGYDPTDKDHTKINWRGQEVVARNLRTIKQYELSPCIFGMNEATTTTDAKSADDAKPPEAEAQEKGAGKAVNLSQQVEDVRQAFHAQYNSPNGPWRYWVNTVYDEYLIVCYESETGSQYYQIAYSENGDAYNFAPMGEWIEGQYEFTPGSEKSFKAGRVLNARIAKRIIEAVDNLHQCLKDAGLMEVPEEDDNTGPQKSDTPSTSDASGSQPEPDGAGTDSDSSTRLLLEIEQEKLKLSEV